MVARLFGRITGRELVRRESTSLRIHKQTHLAIKVYATIRHMTVQEATQHLIEIGLQVEELREKRKHNPADGRDG